VRMRQWLEAYVPAGEDGRCNDLRRVTHDELSPGLSPGIRGIKKDGPAIPRRPVRL